MPSMDKPKAKDRTVDLFSGKTKLEEQQAAIEEVQDAPREPFTGIEGEVGRWRESAYTGQEWVTESFYAGDQERHRDGCSYNGYRLTDRKGWLYLETVGRTGASETAYRYSGIMFPTIDLMKVLEAFVRAAWGKDKEATKMLFKDVCK